MSEYMTAGKVLEGPGGLLVSTSRPAVDNLSDNVMVIWQDKRCISPEQRRKAYALMGEISIWSGMHTEEIKLTCDKVFLLL